MEQKPEKGKRQLTQEMVLCEKPPFNFQTDPIQVFTVSHGNVTRKDSQELRDMKDEDNVDFPKSIKVYKTQKQSIKNAEEMAKLIKAGHTAKAFKVPGSMVLAFGPKTESALVAEREKAIRQAMTNWRDWTKMQADLHGLIKDIESGQMNSERFDSIIRNGSDTLIAEWEKRKEDAIRDLELCHNYVTKAD